MLALHNTLLLSISHLVLGERKPTQLVFFQHLQCPMRGKCQVLGTVNTKLSPCPAGDLKPDMHTEVIESNFFIRKRKHDYEYSLTIL